MEQLRAVTPGDVGAEVEDTQGEHGGAAYGHCVDERRALQLALGYWPARAFSAAGELGVYELLAREGPLDAIAIADRLDIRSRSLPALLDALVALDVLVRTGGSYALASAAPDGEVLALADAAAMHAWAELPAVLREGRRPGPSIYDEVAADADRLEAFADLMARVSAPARAAVAALDFADGEVVCDVGGADGRLAVAIAVTHPAVRCVTFDLPAYIDLVERRTRRASVDDRVTAVGGDFFVDEIPRADTVVLSLVLLDWDEERKRALLEACADALAPDGRLIIVERLDEDVEPETHAAFDLLRSLHFLVLLGEAYTFRRTNLDGWLSGVGLAVVSSQPIDGGFVLVVARRPE